MTHGITAGGIALGITPAGIHLGTVDGADGMVGIARGPTAAGIRLGTVDGTAVGMIHGTTVTGVTATVVGTTMASTTAITAAWPPTGPGEAPAATEPVPRTGPLPRLQVQDYPVGRLPRAPAPRFREGHLPA